MSGAVHFDVPCTVAFDYLVDPANRAQWQSSLRAVADVEGEDGVAGQSWTDVTVVGVRPRMELTDAERPHRWSEAGRWRSFSAVLTLCFTDLDGRSCEVTPTFDVRASGPLRPAAVVLDRLAPSAVRGDLRRAAKILATR